MCGPSRKKPGYGRPEIALREIPARIQTNLWGPFEKEVDLLLQNFIATNTVLPHSCFLTLYSSAARLISHRLINL